MEDKKPVSLPENAQRELKPGESYNPILDPAKKYAEVTPYSVFIGILMVVLFSAAAAYLGLKVGQVFEAAIPIAIIAVGLTSALKKHDGLAPAHHSGGQGLRPGAEGGDEEVVQTADEAGPNECFR